MTESNISYLERVEIAKRAGKTPLLATRICKCCDLEFKPNRPNQLFITENHRWRRANNERLEALKVFRYLEKKYTPQKGANPNPTSNKDGKDESKRTEQIQEPKD